MSTGRGKWACLGVLALSAILACARSPRGENSGPRGEGTVVFVCEHGAAKSVVAAAYFNKLAVERGLRVRAVARGLEPQAMLAASAQRGLTQDGVALPAASPARLSAEEARSALRVVAFCELPAGITRTASVERWRDVPAVGDGYAKARDAIAARVKRLLVALAASSPR